MAKTASKIGKNPLDFLRPDAPRSVSLRALVQPPAPQKVEPPPRDPELDRLAQELIEARGELEGARTSLAGARAEILVRLGEQAKATRELADLQTANAQMTERLEFCEPAMRELDEMRAQQARALKGAGLQGMVAGFFVTLLIMAVVTMLMG